MIWITLGMLLWAISGAVLHGIGLATGRLNCDPHPVGYALAMFPGPLVVFFGGSGRRRAEVHHMLVFIPRPTIDFTYLPASIAWKEFLRVRVSEKVDACFRIQSVDGEKWRETHQ